MPVTVGQQLGSYELTALLGKGGMGEVYRARDTKLKREVAIKILPEEFSRDGDRVSRFQREAEVLASLNHPNIGAIYDLQEASGTSFLVLELVEGETLAERIQRGPFGVEEALDVGKHICEALEAAHEKGVVHRDLKPSNVKITPDGRVKVLDFGLAKAMEKMPASGTLSNSPTLMTIGATQAGVILGTAAYMSPEQAKGLQADMRSDVFSFGGVLYEMITSRQAFHGETVSDVLASVLAREPDFALLPPNLNPRLHELLQRCFQKNPKRRWQAVGDLKAELETIEAAPRLAPASAEAGRAQRPLWLRTLAFLMGVFVFIFVGIVVGRKLQPSASATVTRFQFLLPQTQVPNSTPRLLVAISQDGSKIAYVANGTNGQVFLRQMSELEPRPLAGAVDAASVFFSPDGQWIGFLSRRDKALKKIAVSGGPVVTVSRLDVDILPIGINWEGDQILLGVPNKGILRISENGGEPETLLSIKPEEGYAICPQLLDGGRALLFSLTPAAGPQTWDRGQIVVQPLPSGNRKVIVRRGVDAHYLPSGYLVYVSEGNLYTAPFDLKRLEAGASVAVVPDVMQVGVPQISYAANGSMVYVPGGEDTTAQRVAVVDRTGQVEILPLPPNSYQDPRISPDGKRIAYATTDAKEVTIWIYDLMSGGSPRKLTFNGKARGPVWSHDGRYIFFDFERDGNRGLFRVLADGTSAPEPMNKPSGIDRSFPLSVDRRGKVLAFESGGNIDSDIWILPLDGSGEPAPFVQGPRTQNNASFSPDGNWLAYASTELAFTQPQVFVQPYPKKISQPYQITTGGGSQPVWSPDGKQLFYFWDSKLFAVDVRTEPVFSFGKPTPLPISGIVQASNFPRNFDVMPDGKFLVLLPPQSDDSQHAGLQANVILNWVEELKQRVPVK
jgi:serine/threonine-protein kinase